MMCDLQVGTWCQFFDMFKLVVVNKAIIHLIFHKVYSINKVFKSLISWTKRDEMQVVVANFKTQWHVVYLSFKLPLMPHMYSYPNFQGFC
jgi:hypothetical protein